ncbi:hypothetical protein [Desulfosporosinus sp. FKB]|uniref:HNH endonuclease n=1 Tax=Desulfosporosinus sp. FKB TaxID=1969835 RepID=UPI000B49E7E8|nr:hypothetical protein [Desulfosporosinus sp. FKB]
MRKLDKPREKPEEVFRTCISNIRDNDLKARLTACEGDIIAASKVFEKKVSNTMLHTIESRDNVAGIVTAKEMIKVYTNKMAKKGAPGRSFYDRLLASPAHGICPLCGQRIVSTIDHHLPKAYYPAFAVVPINLVPSCKDCNTHKIDCCPKSSEEETIHPYFDDITNDLWLSAEVIKSNPPVLRFFVDAPDHWEQLLKKRVRYHFEILNLGTLYSSHAAEELVNIRFSLIYLFQVNGPEAVHQHLLEAARSRAVVHLNSWQTAMYRALANCSWYYTQGVNM